MILRIFCFQIYMAICAGAQLNATPSDRQQLPFFYADRQKGATSHDEAEGEAPGGIDRSIQLRTPGSGAAVRQREQRRRRAEMM